MAATRPDAVLTSAVEVARAAAEEIAEPGTVGEHLGVVMEGDRVATHSFGCTATAYPGWHWAVTLSRVPRARKATISEVHLLPSEGALLSPEWVPYAERLAPGDIGAGDVTPYVEEDPRLEAGWEATGEEDVDQVAIWELGLGRERVLSAEGREAAATRWQEGEHGPESEVARKAPRPCGTCGFFLPMAGALRSVFGVCANEWSPADGSVVSLRFGCGAHSEVDVERREPERIDPPVLDDESDIEFVDR
ncbi:DUF3027 domain-containing protein [Ornithinimicrobium cerasi]|uniref:DUF3027 domain-containing protein n=1 Tax=Ornithinimicrobium cerasi TaxID=2248773 RepID=A0A285VT46_9MICO|nr:DUF3027 domain-containing protein [Ornithinimicrobium cerasi]SOC56406.1 Protein of unknown function [Ornithinimicrobium cerasi]